MRTLIIGAGVAGVTAANTLRQMSQHADITIVSSEQYRYYFRPKLPDLLAGRASLDEIIAYKQDWYEQRNINLVLGTNIEALDVASKIARASNGKTYEFDNVILACGSHSFLPPIPGSDKNGVFTVRTIDDVLAIKEKAKSSVAAAVIGGGVLGIEIASALSELGLKVTILERSNWLMNRQLDNEAGMILARILEDKGMSVLTAVETDEILGDQDVRGIRLKNGEELEAQIVIVAAGVRSNLRLAKDAGLTVDRGVVVDEHLMTSTQDVYAVGDVAQFNGVVYGIIAPAIEQAKIAAASIAGEELRYNGTVRLNTLKVVGVFLTSLGDIQAKDNSDIEYSETHDGVYKKLVLRNGKLVGAIWLGEMAKTKVLAELIEKGISLQNYAEQIVKGELDLAELLK
jgi:NAD(P)H-nitrite reductase large subunit